ncbi:MAG: HAD-IA family hydrolase, partial [Trichococcus flocculiformis]
EYHFRYQGTTHEYMWEAMKNEFNLDAPVGELVERANVIRNRLMEEDGLQPIPGVIPFIARLHEAGVPLAIASSSPLTDIHKAVKALDIEKYFSYFVSGESVAHSKPAPDIFLDAAENLKANPENCVVIEDSRHGVASAHAAGCKCIGVRNLEFPPQDLSLATVIITDFSDLDAAYCRALIG